MSEELKRCPFCGELPRTEEKVVNVGEPVIFENNTDSDFEVSAGIIFHKSGLYDVSIVGKRTLVSKVGRTNAKERTGEWIRDGHHIRCNQCNVYMCDTDREGDKIPTLFCPNCGADMRC